MSIWCAMFTAYPRRTPSRSRRDHVEIGQVSRADRRIVQTIASLREVSNREFTTIRLTAEAMEPRWPGL